MRYMNTYLKFDFIFRFNMWFLFSDVSFSYTVYGDRKVQSHSTYKPYKSVTEYKHALANRILLIVQ